MLNNPFHTIPNTLSKTILFLICFCLLSQTFASILDTVPSIRFDSLSKSSHDSYTTNNPLGIIQTNVGISDSQITEDTVQEPTPLSLLQSLFYPDSVPIGRQSLFDVPDIRWIPITNQPSLLGAFLSSFSTMEILITAKVPLSVFYTNQFDHNQSFGSRFYTCKTISSQTVDASKQMIKVLEPGLTRRYEPNESNSSNSPNSPNSPKRTSLYEKSATSQRQLHSYYEHRLISDPNYPYQCVITIPLYGYFFPFANGMLGFHIHRNGFQNLSDSLVGIVSKDNNGVGIVNIAYKTQEFHIPTIILSIVLLSLYLLIPSLVEHQLFHLMVGASLGAIGLSVIVLFIIYKMTPFKRTAQFVGIAGMLVGYFGDIHHVVFLRLIKRWPVETIGVICFGAILGIIITVWWVKWDPQYSQSTVTMIRFGIVLIFSAIFQSLFCWICLSLGLFIHWLSSPSPRFIPPGSLQSGQSPQQQQQPPQQSFHQKPQQQPSFQHNQQQPQLRPQYQQPPQPPQPRNTSSFYNPDPQQHERYKQTHSAPRTPRTPRTPRGKSKFQDEEIHSTSRTRKPTH
jgi:hypothetical protein